MARATLDHAASCELSVEVVLHRGFGQIPVGRNKKLLVRDAEESLDNDIRAESWKEIGEKIRVVGEVKNRKGFFLVLGAQNGSFNDVKMV